MVQNCLDYNEETPQKLDQTLGAQFVPFWQYFVANFLFHQTVKVLINLMRNENAKQQQSVCPVPNR